MCNPNDGEPVSAASGQIDVHPDDFPWHVGVCDAHCHPTDTMSSVSSVRSMHARALTIMATRSQDQDLVASAAAKNRIRDRAVLASPAKQDTPDKMVPAFGWHPWFSHQLYDDTEASTPSPSSSSETASQYKTEHYRAVLSPQPDDAFIASLPDPIPLSTFIADTRRRVLDAGTALVGEVGLDKAFRLPWPWGKKEATGTAAEHTTADADADAAAAAPPSRDETLTPGGREGRMLSPHHVKMAHQVRVLRAQLRLAGELGVAVSIHGVQAHGVLFDALAMLWKGHEREVVSRKKQKMVATGAEDFSSSSEDEEEEGWGDDAGPLRPKVKGKKDYKPKPFPPRICLHSFSGSLQMMQQYLNPAIPVDAFFSFSTAINLSTAGGESRFADVVRGCPDDRLLVESDLHCAGEEMDRVLEDISRRVCEVKGWPLEEGLARIRRNYEEFIFG